MYCYCHCHCHAATAMYCHCHCRCHPATATATLPLPLSCCHCHCHFIYKYYIYILIPSFNHLSRLPPRHCHCHILAPPNTPQTTPKPSIFRLFWPKRQDSGSKFPSESEFSVQKPGKSDQKRAKSPEHPKIYYYEARFSEAEIEGVYVANWRERTGFGGLCDDF
jgi:hypothetical protein